MRQGASITSVLVNPQIQVVRLEDNIVIDKYESDLKLLVETIEDKYPGIDKWFDKKLCRDYGKRNDSPI